MNIYYKNESDQKKALILTILLYVFFMSILFFIRFVSPSQTNDLLIEEGGGGGISINFGDAETGMGNNYKDVNLKVAEKINSKVTSKVPTSESIITQENTNDETIVIPKNEKTKKIVQNPIPLKENISKTEIKTLNTPEIEKPKVSKNTNDALTSILKGSNKGGDGNDKTTGNKGKLDGNLSSTGYYGNGTGSGGGTGTGDGTGSGSGSGYSLGNRKALSKPTPKYTCNEEGKVVVEVVVDRTGKTLAAVPGVKGTTNTAQCLLEQAKLAALSTKWAESTEAPEKQTGKIIYNFSLRE